MNRFLTENPEPDLHPAETWGQLLIAAQKSVTELSECAQRNSYQEMYKINEAWHILFNLPTTK